jgi:hypothetical protein
MTTPGGAELELAALVGGPGVDGGLNGPGEPTNAWQQAERLGLVEASGPGLGFLDDPGPLLGAAVRGGLSSIVLRLDWARLEPREGWIDDAAMAHYAAVVEAAAERDLGVIASLGDGCLPAWLGAEGWLLPATPERYGRLALAVIDALGDRIEGLVTFEAPARLACAGWLVGAAPPFRRLALLDALAALDGMLSGHLLAADAVAGRRGQLERGLLSSGGALGELEAALLGADDLALPAGIAALLRSQAPGRAGALAAASDAPFGTMAWLRLGRPAGPSSAPAARVLALLEAGPVPEPPEIERRLERLGARRGVVATSVCASRVVAQIDAEGRRTRGCPSSPGSAASVPSLRSLEPGVHGLRRVVAGELVDRWVLGSTREREGLVGIDRNRGDGGARLMATDAAGRDALGLLRGG